MSDDPRMETPLESWKAIASYLNRDTRTVRRWEATEGLPVHRHHHLARSSVYAFPSELDAWRAGRRPEAAEPAPPASRTGRVAAVAALALLALTAANHDSIGDALNAQVTPGQTQRAIWTGAEVDAMGSPSLDGRYLSYTDWNTGDLALRDLVEGTSRRLTNTGGWQKSGDFAELSLLAPDGRQVVYAWFVDKGDDPSARTCRCMYELRVLEIAGSDAGKARVLMRGESQDFWIHPAAWMPDGRSIVVVRQVTRGRRELGLVTVSDGAFRALRELPIVMANHLSVSPDGRRIAAAVIPSGESGKADIILVDTENGSTSSIVTNPAHDSSPSFTRDGTSVLFVSDRTGSNALWRVPLNGDKPADAPVMVTPLPNGAGISGVTGNDAVYYWTGGNSTNIFTAAVDSSVAGRSAPAIAIERFVNANHVPVFSPDGQRLAYYSRRGAAAGNTTQALMIHTFATNEDREVPLTIEPQDGLSWFPDGRSVLVSSLDRERAALSFHRVDVATGRSERLLQTNSAGRTARRPVVTPDGRAIVFGDQSPNVPGKGAGAMILRRFDLRSGRISDVTTGPNSDHDITSFAVSPSGRDIAYLRFDGPDRYRILEVIPANGGPARELFRDRDTGPSRYAGIAWSRDGRYILFVRPGDGSVDGGPASGLWRVPAAGGAAESTGISAGGQIRFPTVAADGSRVMYSVSLDFERGIWTLENFLPRTR